MFGGSSGWGQQNQTQQPSTGGGLFGNTSTTFGQNTGGFGSQNTGGFGQPQQQQNTGGIFGGGGNTSTFGGFGNNANTTQSSNAFGQTRPTFGATGSTFGSNTNTGGGLFGGASASTNTFGSAPSTGGGLFGTKPATTSTFGSGTTSNLFGPKPAGNTFGVGAGQPNPNQIFQYSAGPYAPPPSTGTAQPAYFPTWQQDSTPATIGVGVKDTPPFLFHAISAMEPYRGASWEELRAVDYQQNRKEPTAQPAAGGFGSSTSPFGPPPQQQQNAFGQTNAASNPFAPKPAGSLFGPTSSAAPSFGGTSGGFGQNNTGTGGGIFGNTQQPQQPAFGQTNTNTGSGFFGSGQQNQQPNQGGGLFQNPNPFGTNTQQPTASSAFPGFGATANKPAFGNTSGFGTQSTTPSFGQNTTTTNPPAFGSFNSAGQQQPQQTAGSGLFGPSSTPSFGQTQPGSTGLFNTQNQQAAPQQTGGLFGPSAAKPLFGSAPAATNTTTPSFNFGTQNQQPASTGIFNTPQSQPAAGTTGSLFGPQAQQTQQGQTGGIFNNSSSLFKPAASTTTPQFSFNNNNSTAQQPANTQPPAFGSLGQSGGLFGPNNALGAQSNASKPPGQTQFTGSSLFGPSLTQPATQPTNSIFSGALGQPQPAQTGFLGGSGTQQGTGLLSGIFNQPQVPQQQQQQQQQPTLTASLDQNPYGRNELFAYNGQKLDFSVQPKKPALPPLTASSFRISTPSKSRSVLRGFASPALSASLGRSSPARVGSPKPDRWAGLTEAALTPNAFVPRPSIKKLTITPTSQTSGSGEDRLESVLGKSLVSSTPSRSATPVRPAASPAVNGNNTPSQPPGRNGHQSPQVPGTAPPPAEGQYWCKPSLQRLKQMSKQDLSAINRFSAGRTGYGEVTFLQPVDLTQIDLDELLGNIIHFREMELAVYPDNYPNKPSRGEGLNVPAEISLHNCFAKDKATGAFITDMSDPRHVRFLKRVKSIKDTEFVSYTDEGIWTFKVEHFSKYGLNDDSDESDQEAGRLVADEEDDMPPLRSMHDKDEDEDHDSGIEEEDGDFEATSSGSHSLSGSSASEAMDEEEGVVGIYDEGLVEPIKLKLGHEGLQKLRQMQSSLFNEVKGSIIDRTEGERKQAAADRVKRIFYEREQGFEHAGEDQSALGRRAIKRASFGEPVYPPKLRMPRKYAKIELAQSLTNGSEGVRADGGLALGRSFRCSWGPDGRLVHFGKICAPSTSFSSPSSARVLIESVPLLSSADQSEAQKAKRLLRLHLSRTAISTEDESVPVATLSLETRFRDLAGLFEGSDNSHEAMIFRLGVALFDEIDLKLPIHSADDLVRRIAEIRRKLELSKWLETAVSASVDQELVVNADDLPKKVFTLLTGNQIDRAVDAALQGKDMRLATLISQSGGPEEFKEELLQQLDDWNKYSSTSFISPDYRRIYALLAGISDVSPGDSSSGTGGSGEVLIAKDLDWKRAIGLRLWFSMPFSSTISELLDDYTAALSGPHAPSKPLPPYIEDPKGERKWNIPTQPTDVLYGLIRLYADVGLSLDSLLQPRDSSSSPLDFRLPWHLYMLLSRVLQKRDFEDRDELGYSARADALTQGYAKQLEDCQEWTMAAFVLLHFETDDGREAALRSLLFRHPEPSSTEVDFLTKTLHIPVEWIHESSAAWFASLNDPWREYQSLISANLTDRAQRVLIARLAPEVILRDDLSLLRKLCTPLSQKPPTGWEQGAKLLLDYSDISEEVPRLLALGVKARIMGEDENAERLADLGNKVGRTIQLLPALFPDTANVQQVAVLSDMLSRLHDLAGSLARAGLIERPGISSAHLLGADRLHLLQAKASDTFEKNLTATAVA